MRANHERWVRGLCSVGTTVRHRVDSCWGLKCGMKDKCSHRRQIQQYGGKQNKVKSTERLKDGLNYVFFSFLVLSVGGCVILQSSEGSINSTASSCRSPDRHTKHSLPPVSPPPAITRDRPAAVSHPLDNRYQCQCTEIKCCIQRDVVVPLWHVQTRIVKIFGSFVSEVVKILPIDLNITVNDFLRDGQTAHFFTYQTWGWYFFWTRSAIYWRKQDWQCSIFWLLFPVIITQISLTRVTWGQMIIYSWLCEWWTS